MAVCVIHVFSVIMVEVYPWTSTSSGFLVYKWVQTYEAVGNSYNC